ncbi:hypothetical protein ACJRO7_012880 [Eucalyptus globulus]|uniref:Transposase n=1 Tax=Eucalyptus globulus TaxID=34317 RepID=A0ABD3LNK6_EUCGL
MTIDQPELRRERAGEVNSLRSKLKKLETLTAETSEIDITLAEIVLPGARKWKFPPRSEPTAAALSLSLSGLEAWWVGANELESAGRFQQKALRTPCLFAR